MRYLLLFVVLCLDTQVQADEEEFVASAIRPSNGLEWKTMTVRIIDDKNEAIVGATVRPWALRAGNGHGAWNEEFGSPRETVTDRNGETPVVYPNATPSGEGNIDSVSSVSIMVRHPEYVARNIHVDVPTGDSPVIPQLTLKSGIRLRVAGVDPGSEQPLDHCHLFIENGDVVGDEFVREADGWLQSHPIDEDRRWFRIVHAAPGQPPRFSQLVAWSPDDPASRERRLEVRTGTRVQGKISDSVDRPIERGHVVAWCGSPVRKEELGRFRPIIWLETANVARDGTFVFESLPTGYLAQFYAFANDSISAQPTTAAYEIACKWFNVEARGRAEVFRYGQVLRLVGGKSDLSLEMEPAAKVRIKCVDAGGKPVSGVIVSSWPNQFIVGAGSTIFCDRRSSLRRLTRPSQRYDWRETSPYVSKTDDDGIALMSNLPGAKQSFVATSDLWVGEEVSAEIDPDEIHEVVVKLQRAP